jgi:hypothetical protein
MPVDKSGKYHMNPGAARMSDANPKPAFGHGDRKEKRVADPGKQEDGAPTHVELHDNQDGSYHTLHHKGDGAEPERKDHATLHEAHHATNQHVGGTDSDLHDHSGSAAEPANDIGELEAGADEY